MNEQEQKLADELEEIIQAAQNNQALKPQYVPAAEADLATHLAQLSRYSETSPAFVAGLRTRLHKRAVELQTNKNSSAKASFWRDLQQMLKDVFKMKPIFALGAILAIIIFAGLLVLGRGLLVTTTPQTAETTPLPFAAVPDEETDTAMAESPTESTTPEVEASPLPPEPTAVPLPDPSELAQLPRLGTQNPGGGFGGGGGGDTAVPEGQPMPLPVDGEFDMKMMDPFSGTIFILNSALPGASASGQVLQRQGETAIDADFARQVANQYGFSGPIYVETYPSDVPAEGPGAPPTSYVAFDGARSLRIDPWAVTYNNEAAAARLNFETPTPHPEEGAIAEAFLRDRGQLNFPYAMEERESYDVFFYRLVDGMAVTEPEITVTVNQEGEVVSVFDNVVADWKDVGSYPLISPEAAWQRVLDGVFENDIRYQIIQNDLGQPVAVEDPFVLVYKYWPREYTPGNEIHLYDWPLVYRPVDDGTPLLKIRQYTLAAGEATLNAIADGRDQQLHIWGMLNPDNSISVAGWEALSTYEPILQQGVVRRQGDQLVFFGKDGDIYILPEAPADIENGLEVNVFGFGVRDTGLEHPVLDWESIDKYIEYPEPAIEEPIDSRPTEPFSPLRYDQVEINETKLSYVVTYLFPEIPEDETMLRRPSPTFFLQPAWAFSGTADNGDTIKLFVQAVDEAYLQPAP